MFPTQYFFYRTFNEITYWTLSDNKQYNEITINNIITLNKEKLSNITNPFSMNLYHIYTIEIQNHEENEYVLRYLKKLNKLYKLYKNEFEL